MSNNQESRHIKYAIDLSSGKYSSRYERLLNILFYSKEIPNDLHDHLNMSYANFRKTISILKQRGLIRTISGNGSRGYILDSGGKKLTGSLYYLKYRDCIEAEEDRHLSIERRKRRRQFAYLYALFDRVAIKYENFSKPPLEEVDVFGNDVFFYSALDFKRLIGVESTSFIGSRVLGFLIGKGRIYPVYRTNFMLRAFGSHEALVPFLLMRHFAVTIDSAILICNSEFSVMNITRQIIESTGNDPEKGVNTLKYDKFYVLPSDDTFLSRFNDLYTDCSAVDQQIIKKYNIDTSKQDSSGKHRYNAGTGFIKSTPVLVISGNVNTVALKRFICYVEMLDISGYIICDQRDLAILEEVVYDKPIELISV